MKKIVFYTPDQDEKILAAFEGKTEKSEKVKVLDSLEKELNRTRTSITARYNYLMAKGTKKKRAGRPSGNAPTKAATAATFNGSSIRIPLRSVSVTQDEKGKWFLDATI